MLEQLAGVQPRPADIFVAVMGMTGAGKSTFISLCTGEEVVVGHDLQACTQQVGVYKCKWSATCDIYLLDTPGFDDTHRSDTEVLKEIAAWLTKSYSLNLKLSGILYLHRITDPRMQGSAKKNLFMLKKLCGADGLKNVLLVSTMWENVDGSLGSSREGELTNTEEFWGFLIRSGARVKRHDNGRESAMRLLKELVKNKKMAMSIQQEMVTEGKTLDQTQAGKELDSELQVQRDKFKRELAEVQEMVQEAMKARDQESAEALREHKADTQRKLDKILQGREDLKMTLEEMHAERFAELEKKHREQKEEVERKHEEETRRRSVLEQELKAQMDLLTRALGMSKLPARDSDTGSPAILESPVPSPISEPSLDILTQASGVSELPTLDSGTISPAIPERPVPSSLPELSLNLLDRKLEVSELPARDSDTGLPAIHESPAPSSISKPSRTRDHVSLALSEEWYSFLGPNENFFSVPTGLTIERYFIVPVYVALGVEGAWYYHYHLDGACLTELSDNMQREYPRFHFWMSGDRAHQCPVQVSLGLGGNFYVRLEDGEWTAQLPQETLGKVDDSVNRVWFGHAGSYVVEMKKDGVLHWDMAGCYEALEDHLRKWDSRGGVKELAMNISNPQQYAYLTQWGDICYFHHEAKHGIPNFMERNYNRKYDWVPTECRWELE